MSPKYNRTLRRTYHKEIAQKEPCPKPPKPEVSALMDRSPAKPSSSTDKSDVIDLKTSETSKKWRRLRRRNDPVVLTDGTVEAHRAGSS